MAISPKSRGLGNIGNIVNRQGMAAPTRPAPKMATPVQRPAPKLAPQMRTPVQRPQPMSKLDPMTEWMKTQSPQPMTPQVQNPAMQMRMPVERPAPQPFNPQPNPGQDMTMGRSVINGQDPFFPQGQAPQPFNPDPNPGQGPMDMEYKPGRDYMPGGENDPINMNPGMFGQGGGLGNMVTNAVGQGFSGIFGNMFGAPGQQALQTGMQGVGQMFGNPNPMSSDYDQLEGSSFNTNPSMGGSLFGGGGFANY